MATSWLFDWMDLSYAKVFKKLTEKIVHTGNSKLQYKLEKINRDTRWVQIVFAFR